MTLYNAIQDKLYLNLFSVAIEKFFACKRIYNRSCFFIRNGAVFRNGTRIISILYTGVISANTNRKNCFGFELSTLFSAVFTAFKFCLQPLHQCCGFSLVSMRIGIQHIRSKRIRIQFKIRVLTTN